MFELHFEWRPIKLSLEHFPLIAVWHWSASLESSDGDKTSNFQLIKYRFLAPVPYMN